MICYILDTPYSTYDDLHHMQHTTYNILSNDYTNTMYCVLRTMPYYISYMICAIICARLYRTEAHLFSTGSWAPFYLSSAVSSPLPFHLTLGSRPHSRRIVSKTRAPWIQKCFFSMLYFEARKCVLRIWAYVEYLLTLYENNFFPSSSIFWFEL